MKKGVIYGRVSSKDQDYTRQVTELKLWATSCGVEIEKDFLEKVSASKTAADERKELQKMLKFIEKNKIRNVFCWELSRLGRRNKDVIQLFEQLTAKKVCLYVKKDNLITLDENGNKTSTATIMINVLSALAEMEIEQLSARTISGRLQAAKKGAGFNGCYGYDIAEGKPVINEAQANDIKIIFSMLADGVGCRSIAAHLNATTALKKWTNSSIYTIARNPIYKGERRYKSLTLEAPHVVSSELWQKANNELDKKNKYAGNKKVHVNILQGKIFCKKCGEPMYQVVNPTQGTNVYRCSNKNIKCGVSVSRPWLYHVVKYHAQKYAENALQEDTKSKLQLKVDLNNDEIIQLKKDKTKLSERVKRARLVFIDGDLSKEEYNEAKQGAEQEINNLEFKILNLKAENENLMKSINGEIGHFSGDNTTFKEQIKDIIEHVIIWDEVVEINFDGWFRQIYLKPEKRKLRQMIKENKFSIS